MGSNYTGNGKASIHFAYENGKGYKKSIVTEFNRCGDPEKGVEKGKATINVPYENGIDFSKCVMEFNRCGDPEKNHQGKNENSDSRKKRRLWYNSWWDPSEKSNAADFFQDTSLHGMVYITKPKLHMCERISWAIAFSLSLVLGGYLMTSVWMKYVYSPVLISFQPFETFIDQIPFPAVTICNMNKILKSKAEEYMRDAQGPEFDKKTIDARKNVYYLDHVCSTTQSFTKRFNYSSNRGAVPEEILKLLKINKTDDGQINVARFLQRASQPCSHMLKLCLWNDEIHDCSELFNPIETNFGKCCTFNMVPQTLLHRYRNDSRDDSEEVEGWAKWNLDTDGLLLEDSFQRKFPRRQKRAGKSSGLSILLDPALDEYFCTSTDSQGFRLATHLSIDVPHITDFGVGIQPNVEVFTSIRPEITMVDESIAAYAQDKRNCYFEGEFKLGYYNYYTSWNCFDECIANLTFNRCNCVRYYMPRDDSKKLCGPDTLTCADAVKKESYKSGIESLCNFCLPTCTELGYVAETTTAPIQQDVKLWTDDFNNTAPWARSNVSIVHIYFGHDSTYARVRTQVYGWTDLVSNCGGLLGLCMGFSCLSFLEVIYYFTLRAFCHRRKRKLEEEENSDDTISTTTNYNTTGDILPERNNSFPMSISGTTTTSTQQESISPCDLRFFEESYPWTTENDSSRL